MGILLDMKIKDAISEESIEFDPMLKFWYDSNWVAKIPIGETNSLGTRENSLDFIQEKVVKHYLPVISCFYILQAT